jgi:hypothetical protein
MALIAYGPNIDQYRKKLGNTVFSVNHYGSFARKLVKPINPRSSYQTVVRNSLRSLAKSWGSLSQAKILGWNSFAIGFKFSNRLGQPIKLTGEATYIKLNRNIASVGGTTISTAPAISASNVPVLAGVQITIASGAVSMIFAAGSVATNIVEVRSSGIVSSGRTYNSKFKTFTQFASNATSPQNMSADWVAMFGTAPVATDVVFFTYRVIDSLTGFATLYQKVRVVCT